MFVSSRLSLAAGRERKGCGQSWIEEEEEGENENSPPPEEPSGGKVHLSQLARDWRRAPFLDARRVIAAPAQQAPYCREPPGEPTARRLSAAASAVVAQRVHISSTRARTHTKLRMGGRASDWEWQRQAAPTKGPSRVCSLSARGGLVTLSTRLRFNCCFFFSFFYGRCCCPASAPSGGLTRR